MKILVTTLSVLALNFAFASTLEGEITFNDKSAKGVLYVFAKKHDDSIPMPLAVKRIPNPKFPVKFSISAADAMMKTIPFQGPFKVIARLSKSGDALDKTGPQGESKGALKIGTKGIKIELNK